MRLAVNVSEMATECCSRGAIEEKQFLIRKPRSQVREEKQRGVGFPRHEKVKAAMERHPAMICRN